MERRDKKRKLRKGKIIALAVIVLLIIIAIVVIVSIVKSGKDKDKQLDEENIVESTGIALPSTTYSNMEVTDVKMEYLSDNKETMFSMIINNTTENTVDKENLKAVVLNDKEEILAQIPTYIEHLEPGEQYSISVVLKGDLTSASKVLLQK